MTGARRRNSRPFNRGKPASRQRAPSRSDRRRLANRCRPNAPRADMTVTTPRTNTRVVATTVVRSPARPARVMGDSCRQVSWLAAHARRFRLPAGCPAVAFGATLAAYSCGGSRGFEGSTSHRVPFSPAEASTWRPGGNRHAGEIEAKRSARLSTAASVRRRIALACWPPRHGGCWDSPSARACAHQRRCNRCRGRVATAKEPSVCNGALLRNCRHQAEATVP